MFIRVIYIGSIQQFIIFYKIYNESTHEIWHPSHCWLSKEEEWCGSYKWGQGSLMVVFLFQTFLRASQNPYWVNCWSMVPWLFLAFWRAWTILILIYGPIRIENLKKGDVQMITRFTVALPFCGHLRMRCILIYQNLMCVTLGVKNGLIHFHDWFMYLIRKLNSTKHDVA